MDTYTSGVLRQRLAALGLQGHALDAAFDATSAVVNPDDLDRKSVV